MKSFKKMFVFVSIFAMSTLQASAALAEDPKPSGAVSVETTSVAAGIGYQWGEGILTYEGKEYKFKVKGLSVIDVGISSISHSTDCSAERHRDFDRICHCNAKKRIG
jgi:hypothetical protein